MNVVYLCCNDCIRIHYTNESMPDAGAGAICGHEVPIVQTIARTQHFLLHSAVYSAPLRRPAPSSIPSSVILFNSFILFSFRVRRSVESFSFALLCIRVGEKVFVQRRILRFSSHCLAYRK